LRCMVKTDKSRKFQGKKGSKRASGDKNTGRNVLPGIYRVIFKGRGKGVGNFLERLFEPGGAGGRGVGGGVRTAERAGQLKEKGIELGGGKG